jgi:hypothetical protein
VRARSAYRATKGGRVKPRRAGLFSRELAEFRIRCGRRGDDELLFGNAPGERTHLPAGADRWRLFEQSDPARRRPAVR